jgi:acyl-CoA synthetase (AMP-forming)/AMP-acid ligase II
MQPVAELLGTAADIPQVVLERARRTPDKPFLIQVRQGLPEVAVSFAELADRAKRYAAAYRRLGLQPGAIVVIMIVSHPDLASAFLGAIMAGLVPSLFPPATPKMNRQMFWSAQQEVFRHIGVDLVVATAVDAAELRRYMPDFPGAVIDVEVGPGDDRFGDSLAAPDGIAFLQHSSGTTGAKKGVILTHQAVLASVASLAEALDARPDDIVASWLPLYHDMGLINCLVTPLLLGLTVVQMDAFEWVARPPIMLEAMQRHRATLCWMPNFAFHHLMRTTPAGAQYDLSSARAIIDAAEPCKPETLAMFADRFASSLLSPDAIKVGYGMAENVCIATQTPIGERPRTIVAAMDAYTIERVIRPPRDGEAAIAFVSVGKSIPGTALRIVDESLRDLPDRHVGEIAVTSPYLFTGYFRRPLPPGILVDGWYMSGDLGFMADDELYVSGRKDDLLIINGRNLYVHDVEYAINRNTTVKPGRCVVMGIFSARLGSQVLVVIAETTDPDKAAAAALRSTIRELVQANFGVTVHDVVIKAPGWLVKTTSGKISREANQRLYLQESPVA